MNNYKEEIEQTRLGSLGSSDANIIAYAANNGAVNKAARKRLAIAKGLIPFTPIPTTEAMRLGDAVEMAIYEHLHSTEGMEGLQSNPMWQSAIYSRSNIRLISHPDMVRKDNEKRTIYVYEVKASKYETKTVLERYMAQLYVHYCLAKEIARPIRYRVKVFLVHYNTDGIGSVNDFIFDQDRITLKEVRFKNPYFDLNLGMDVINKFLEDFTEYYEGDEIDADFLPANVKNEFDAITLVIREIKERELKVEEFKKKLYNFLVEKNVKSIKNEVFSITRVDGGETSSFDAKAFMEDYATQHPRLAKKLKEKYRKVTKRKGYCSIKLNEK